MATRYEKFLGTVPCLTGCTRRELRVLAGLVDDLSIPAGGLVRAARGEVILVASGDAVVLPDQSVIAATALRVVVIGRREVRSLLHEAPDLGFRLLRGRHVEESSATAARARNGDLLLGSSMSFAARAIGDRRIAR